MVSAAVAERSKQEQDVRALEQFLYHEARLLDEKRWTEWDALFTEDGTYWMPASQDQPDPVDHVSLIYEDRLLRTVRIERFTNQWAYSLQPEPRTSHLVSNVMLDSFDPQTNESLVTSRFVVFEYRRGQQSVFGGQYLHHLILQSGQFYIRQKRVNLVNCESPLENINVYL